MLVPNLKNRLETSLAWQKAARIDMTIANFTNMLFFHLRLKYNLLRSAKIEDASALLAIYKPYVEGTAITFEYDVPSVEGFAGRIRKTLEKYPYLVLEQDAPTVDRDCAGDIGTIAGSECATAISRTHGLLASRHFQRLRLQIRAMVQHDLDGNSAWAQI